MLLIRKDIIYRYLTEKLESAKKYQKEHPDRTKNPEGYFLNLGYMFAVENLAAFIANGNMWLEVEGEEHIPKTERDLNILRRTYFHKNKRLREERE